MRLSTGPSSAYINNDIQAVFQRSGLRHARKRQQDVLLYQHTTRPRILQHLQVHQVLHVCARSSDPRAAMHMPTQYLRTGVVYSIRIARQAAYMHACTEDMSLVQRQP